VKSTIKRIAQACLASCFPKPQPLHNLDTLQLTPAQLQTLAAFDINEIRLDYRGSDRAVIQHSSWATGEKDDYLPRALSDIPRDTLVITRTATGAINIQGGPAYQRMNVFKFEEIMTYLLANTRDSISFVASMQRSDTSSAPQYAAA
jgi:hypothetical protein